MPDVVEPVVSVCRWTLLGSNRDKVYAVLLVLLIGFISWMYIQAIDTEILGFTHDDGVYAITAKALAQGKGFTLLHVVTSPAEIKYPFVYPLILSLVWLFNPHFPQNLPALNMVTILFGAGAFWIMYLFYRQTQRFPGWLALLCIALAASNFFFIYFFSTVMSEAPYVFFSLLTLWAFCRKANRLEKDTAERFERDRGQDACDVNTNALESVQGDQAAEGTVKISSFPVRDILLLAFLSAVTFLTRIPGITLMGAIGTWLLINRQWRNAVLYGAACFVLGILPWALWVKTHTPVVTDMNYAIFNPYSNYGLEFAHNVTTSRNYLAGLQQDLRSLLGRTLEDLFPLIPNFFKIYPAAKHYSVAGFSATAVKDLVTLLCTYLLAGYFLLQGISTVRKGFGGRRFNPKPFSVAGLYVFYYLVVITFWNYEDQMARFIVVITPLLWMFLFKPLLPLLSRLSLRDCLERSENSFLKQALRGIQWKPLAALSAVVLLSAIALWPTPNSYKIVYKSRHEHWVESGKVKWLWADYQDAFRYINTKLPPGPLAVGTDTVFHLYTGRQTLYIFYASLRKARGQFTPDSVDILMRSIDHYGMKYLVVEPHMQFRTIKFPMNAVAKSLLDSYPERFEPVYASPRYAIQIFKILPPPKESVQPAKPIN